MKKYTRLLIQLFIDVILIASIYFGFFKDIEGAYNMAMFLIWLGIVVHIGMLICFGDAAKSFAEENVSSWHFCHFLCIFLIEIAALIYKGYFVTAVFVIIGAIVRYSIQHKANELKELNND